MRHAFALYDAPMPALAALRGLARAGFAPADVALVAARPASEAAALAADRLLPADLGVEPWPDALDPASPDESALARALEARGLSLEDAATCAEGVARHRAHLVVVCCPTLAAPLAEAALDAALPPALDVHRARWATQRVASAPFPA